MVFLYLKEGKIPVGFAGSQVRIDGIFFLVFVKIPLCERRNVVISFDKPHWGEYNIDDCKYIYISIF
jgi:hypothetical protein